MNIEAPTSPPSASGAVPQDGPCASPAYPAELVEQVSWNGETIVIRPIRGDDEEAFHAFIDRLEQEDLRLRFFGPPRALTHEQLFRLTHIDYAHEMALVAVRTLPDGQSEVLGVVRAVTEANLTDAELGIIVRSDLKSRGLGGLLLRQLIRGLAGRGVLRLLAYVLHENLAMRQLALSLGFVANRGGSDGQAASFVLDTTRSAATDAGATDFDLAQRPALAHA